MPTATGIAVERGIFDRLYAGTPYSLVDIADSSGDADAHYTHSIPRAFREGGGAPPVWARSRGADSKLLGITFMDERLGIFVRVDDVAQTVGDLAGRRIGLPVWPGLVFNFWRFAAEKGFHSALARHGMSESSVTRVDVEETPATDAPGGRRSRYDGQLGALLAGRIDAMFGKGPELALLLRDALGRIRLLYDIARSPVLADRVNNSTPRLVTVGARLVAEERDVVVRYLQGLIRAATWAQQHPNETRSIVAKDCAVEETAIDHHLAPDYAKHLMPSITPELVATVDVLKSFLHERGYLERDFDLALWIDPSPLREARERERGGAA